jgi:hypothetical protein
MPYLTVRDIDICFDRAGAGAPLLTISGSRGDLRRKPNLLESPLAKAFDVLAYDQRGLGRTSKKPTTLTRLQAIAAQLLTKASSGNQGALRALLRLVEIAPPPEGKKGILVKSSGPNPDQEPDREQGKIKDPHGEPGKTNGPEGEDRKTRGSDDD